MPAAREKREKRGAAVAKEEKKPYFSSRKQQKISSVGRKQTSQPVWGAITVILYLKKVRS